MVDTLVAERLLRTDQRQSPDRSSSTRRANSRTFLRFDLAADCAGVSAAKRLDCFSMACVEPLESARRLRAMAWCAKTAAFDICVQGGSGHDVSSQLRATRGPNEADVRVKPS